MSWIRGHASTSDVSCRDLAEAAAGLKAQDVQENRVIELSKKNRHLHLLLEKERASAAALQAEVQHLGLAAKTSKLDPQVRSLFSPSFSVLSFCWQHPHSKKPPRLQSGQPQVHRMHHHLS